VRRLDWTELVDVVASPVRRRDLGDAGGELLIVGLPDDVPHAAEVAALTRAVTELPVAVAVDASPEDVGSTADLADVVATGDDLEAVVEGFARAPRAGTALALLLRGGAGRTVWEGLVAESAVYSGLQGGAEFAAWREAHPPRPRSPAPTPPVSVERRGDVLEVTLDRPEVRNALDASMRDALWEAFAIALSDPTIRVRWRGAGPAFSAGGDLDEFGSRPDPATGHLVRLTRSLGAVVDELAARVTVELHGACFGSGIELPAFAGRVLAAPDTSIALPELALGLIPGAGGTTSLPRRIGRHRTAWLALSGRTIDAETALAWGLVDEVGIGTGA
jgi:hypothetical protein